MQPLKRLSNNSFIANLVSEKGEKRIDSDKELFRLSHRSSMYQFILYLSIKKELGTLDRREKSFLDELPDNKSILEGIRTITQLRTGQNISNKEVRKLRDYCESGTGIYQFLDKTHSNLLFDIIVNQLSCPLHCVVSQCKRYNYKAKTKKMYTDIMVYDECRYLYEWMPAIDQMYHAFNDKSWQYIMRFALDGLVKERQQYNNEYFFQCAVISGGEEQFHIKTLSDREQLY